MSFPRYWLIHVKSLNIQESNTSQLKKFLNDEIENALNIQKTREDSSLTAIYTSMATTIQTIRPLAHKTKVLHILYEQNSLGQENRVLISKSSAILHDYNDSYQI